MTHSSKSMHTKSRRENGRIGRIRRIPTTTRYFRRKHCGCEARVEADQESCELYESGVNVDDLVKGGEEEEREAGREEIFAYTL